MRSFGLVRPLLFALEAERAHAATLLALRLGLVGGRPAQASPRLGQTLWGLDFPNPVGLAAGFDKNAEVAAPMLAMGFGFVETGSVTPRPQAGNPRPRVFRLAPDRAVINRLGFNNQGHERFVENLTAQRRRARGIVGVNLGANRDSADPAADYVAGVRRFAALADYLVVNVSSPNTPGLRDLQGRRQLTDLLQRLRAARAEADRAPPLLVKIAPDLDDGQVGSIVATARAHGIDGLIVGNTTLARPTSLRGRHAAETGGLSGAPLRALSTRIVRAVRRHAEGTLPIVGVGGIASAADAYEKIKAGASLVQLYSALVFEGPALVRRIVDGLDALVARDGLETISEAVGVEAR